MLKICIYALITTTRRMSKKCKVDLAKHISNSPNSNLSHENLECSNQNYSEITNNDIDNVVRLPSPVKSLNDKKEYSAIRLPNGLTALLISDVPNLIPIESEDEAEPMEEESEVESEDGAESRGTTDSEGYSQETHLKNEEKLAACSLTIGVGSFSDPDDIPGLAHFLEHMVFMGSSKFPKENEFDAFVKKHGGSDNASTECEYTTFYFECQDKYMPKGLDIFSQFFISPLMKREAMTREREAVESEFTIALPSDVFRRQQILATTASSQNPGGKFVWGNLKTLQENVSDDHLYESVHKFREMHYSAHRMTLAIQARVTLDRLEHWVVKYFSDIPSNNYTPMKDTLQQKELFEASKFCNLYYIQSVNDNILLDLNWHMPPVKSLYKSKPTSLLSWTIGHEGKGSLISYLRKKLWALGLTAGHNEDGIASNSLYSMFTVSIILTEKGLRNLKEVLDATFSYIKMIQNHGPDERAFLELQEIADIDFRYDEETPAVDNVEFLSDNMQIYPPEDYIQGDELFFNYEPNEITHFLNLLSPTTVNILLSKKNHGPDVTLDKTEPWFKTQYTSKNIPPEWVKNWKNIEPYKEFSFPEPNEYITSDFRLFHEGEGGPLYPEKILSTDLVDLWYKPDRKFKLPLGFIGFQVINKSAFESVEDNVLLSMYTSMLNHLLVEELYPANMALLEYKIAISDRAFIIEVYGFNEKLYILLNKIVNYIINFHEYITADLLNAFIETNTKSYYNNNLKVSNLCSEVRMKILLDRYFTSVDKYNTLPQLSLDLMKEFSKNFFNSVYIQCLVQGNIVKDTALSICEDFVHQLQSGHLPELDRPMILVQKLPEGEKCCRLQSFNLNDSNCITTNYYQLGPGKIREYCIIDLLMMLIEEPLFDRLRTQEQLGYDVSCSLRDTFGILGFSVSVVSQIHKHTVDHVEERITAFLVSYLEVLKYMPRQEFDEVVQALINLKKCCDLHIKEEVKRNWSEIKCFEYAFDRLEKEMKILSTLEPEDVIKFLESRTHPASSDYRKLTVQVVGYSTKEDAATSSSIVQPALPPKLNYNLIKKEPTKDPTYFISDITDFKEKLTLFPKNKVFK